MYGKIRENESIYQILLIQLLLFFKLYGLKAEENSEKGRYDFGFPNKKVSKEYILIEIKILNNRDDEKSLHKECIDAIDQIEKQGYAEKHKKNGYKRFIKYGIAF